MTLNQKLAISYFRLAKLHKLTVITVLFNILTISVISGSWKYIITLAIVWHILLLINDINETITVIYNIENSKKEKKEEKRKD